MLKTSSTELKKSKKSRVKIGVSSKAKLNNKTELNDRVEYNSRDKFDNGEFDYNEIEDNEVAEEKNHQKTRAMSKFKKTIRILNFFTFGARLTFIKLRQIFVKAPILYYFNPEYYI